MTRLEMIERFAANEKTNRDHAFTFHVLTEIWISQNKPEQFELDFDRVLSLVRTSRRNLFRWISELHEFGFITYDPRKNQHGTSLVSLVGGVQNGTAGSLPVSRMAQQPGLPVSNLAQQPIGSVQNGTAPKLPVSILAQQPESASVQNGTATGLVVSRMAQQPIGSVQNGTADSEPEKLSTLVGVVNQRVSESSVDNPRVHERAPDHARYHHHDYTIIKSDSLKKEDTSYDDGDKGVQGKKRKREKSKNEPAIAFSDSPLFEIDELKAAFADNPAYQCVDFTHYHWRLSTWKNEDGTPKRRNNWFESAGKFLLNDFREGKLITITHRAKAEDTKPNASNNRSVTIEPTVTTGRRFGSWERTT